MNIDPRLVQRLTRPLNQPGITNHRMADRLIERYERLVNRLPLLDQQLSRWSAIANLETEQVPIVYAQAQQWDGDTPDRARSRQPQLSQQQAIPAQPHRDRSPSNTLTQVAPSLSPTPQPSTASTPAFPIPQPESTPSPSVLPVTTREENTTTSIPVSPPNRQRQAISNENRELPADWKSGANVTKSAVADSQDRYTEINWNDDSHQDAIASTVVQAQRDSEMPLVTTASENNPTIASNETAIASTVVQTQIDSESSVSDSEMPLVTSPSENNPIIASNETAIASTVVQAQRDSEMPLVTTASENNPIIASHQDAIASTVVQTQIGSESSVSDSEMPLVTSPSENNPIIASNPDAIASTVVQTQIGSESSVSDSEMPLVTTASENNPIIASNETAIASTVVQMQIGSEMPLVTTASENNPIIASYQDAIASTVVQTQIDSESSVSDSEMPLVTSPSENNPIIASTFVQTQIDSESSVSDSEMPLVTSPSENNPIIASHQDAIASTVVQMQIGSESSVSDSEMPLVTSPSENNPTIASNETAIASTVVQAQRDSEMPLVTTASENNSIIASNEIAIASTVVQAQRDSEMPLVTTASENNPIIASYQDAIASTVVQAQRDSEMPLVTTASENNPTINAQTPTAIVPTSTLLLGKRSNNTVTPLDFPTQDTPLLQLAVQPTTEGIIQAKYDAAAPLPTVFSPTEVALPSIVSALPPRSQTQAREPFWSIVPDLPLSTPTTFLRSNAPPSPPIPTKPPEWVNRGSESKFADDRPAVEDSVASTAIARSFVREDEPLEWVTPSIITPGETLDPAPSEADDRRKSEVSRPKVTVPTVTQSAYPVAIARPLSISVNRTVNREQPSTRPNSTDPDPPVAVITTADSLIVPSTPLPIVATRRGDTLARDRTEKAPQPRQKDPLPLSPLLPEKSYRQIAKVEPETADAKTLPSVSALPTIQVQANFKTKTLEPLVLSHPVRRQAGGTALSQAVQSSAPIAATSTTTRPVVTEAIASPQPRPTRSTSYPRTSDSFFGQQVQSVTPQVITANAPPAIDIDALTAKVERKVLRRLVAESERRGKYKWR